PHERARAAHPRIEVVALHPVTIRDRPLAPAVAQRPHRRTAVHREGANSRSWCRLGRFAPSRRLRRSVGVALLPTRSPSAPADAETAHQTLKRPVSASDARSRRTFARRMRSVGSLPWSLVTTEPTP